MRGKKKKQKAKERKKQTPDRIKGRKDNQTLPVTRGFAKKILSSPWSPGLDKLIPWVTLGIPTQLELTSPIWKFVQ